MLDLGCGVPGQSRPNPRSHKGDQYRYAKTNDCYQQLVKPLFDLTKPLFDLTKPLFVIVELAFDL